jgi:bacteriorhodopsin
MASDLGATPVQVEWVRGAADGGYPIPYRQVWYARYIDWTITTPMLLLELLLTTGLPLSQLFIVRLFLASPGAAQVYA